MKILMLSIDKGLLGKNPMGDVIERHKKYGEFCERLDIIVLSQVYPEQVPMKSGRVEGSRGITLSPTVTTHPTNSCCKLFYYFDAIKLAKNLFQKNQYDLIICQDPFLTGLIGARLKKKFHSKLLIHFHGDFRFPLWPVVKKADALRVMSHGQKEKLIKKGIDANKIFIIPTPVDLSRFQTGFSQGDVVSSLPTGDTMHYRSSQETGANTTKTLLFVGRLEPVKNLAWFLDVFKNVQENYPNVKFLIIGQGSEEEKLKLKTQKLNLNNKIEFIPQVPHTELPKFYSEADIVILPSKSESFGKVLIEAGACAKPVISTMTTGAKEIVLEGITGFLTPIGDDKAMSETILKLLNNEELAKQIGASAREHIKQNFDGQKNLQKIKQMWSKIIAVDNSI